jgi:hypothetical protein
VLFFFYPYDQKVGTRLRSGELRRGMPVFAPKASPRQEEADPAISYGNILWVGRITSWRGKAIGKTAAYLKANNK